MADISNEITAVEEASRGSAVRYSLVSALTKLNAVTLPSVTSQDEGSLLVVNEDGEWEVDSSSYIPTPTASQTITSNGTYDVTNKAQAVVNVATSVTVSQDSTTKVLTIQ